MPRRALRCVVDLNIQAISAPGVWLSSRTDVYVSISMFGQYRNTRLVSSIFPLLFHEPFRFEKTYYSAIDPQDVSEFLDDELVVVELVQMSDYTDGAVRLGSFSSSAREFLYPYPSLCPTYASGARELLFTRTIAFPGIAPKLEFTSKAVIKESYSPELDALEDALEEEKIARRSRSRSRSRARSRSVSRTRSLSRTRTCRSSSGVRYTFDDDLSESSSTSRPPFVVRHLETSLIGRLPGTGPLKPQKLKKKGKKLSRPSSALSLGSYDDLCYPSYRQQYHLQEVLRDSDGITLPLYTSKFVSSDDEDAEVAALTSTRPYTPPPIIRPRSASPYLYKSSYSTRFTRSPSPIMSERVARALRRSVSPVRYTPVRYTPVLDRYSPVLVDRYSPVLATGYNYNLARSLNNLALETDFVSSRRYYPRYL